MSTEKNGQNEPAVRYSDAELEEFKQIILEKLEKANRDYEQLKKSIQYLDGNDIQDTSNLSKEETGKLAERQEKFIKHLKEALIRIENKTYGICRETGKLIPKERLRAVPHATLSIDAKQSEKKKSPLL